MEKEKKVLKKTDLAQVSGGTEEPVIDIQDAEAKVVAGKKPKTFVCKRCSSKNVKRSQHNASVIKVTCKDCGYVSYHNGVL